MKSANIRYLPAVDHLRGFAALLIVFYHSLQLITHKLTFNTEGFSATEWQTTNNPFLALIIEGHSSVALFMVLSGFIFTFGSLDKTISYKGFLASRLFRIFPLFLFLSACGLAIHPTTTYTLASELQFFLMEAPGLTPAGPYLAMSWAIGVEFQFYAVFPFILRFLQRDGVRYVLALWALCIVIRVIGYLESGNAHDVAYWTILGRMDQFLFGMVCAVAYLRLPRLIRALKYSAPLFAGLVLGWLTYFNHRGGWPSSHAGLVFWPTADAIVWGAFLLSYLAGAHLVPRAVSKVLAWLGSLSFSIYMLHYVVLTTLIHNDFLASFAHGYVANSLLNCALIVAPITVALATMTYALIEKPFLDMRRPYMHPQVGERASEPRAGVEGAQTEKMEPTVTTCTSAP